MGIELRPDEACFEARERGCTCAWLRGFGVDDVNPNDWVGRIIERDESCPIHESSDA